MARDSEERVAWGVLQLAASHPTGVVSFSRCRKELPGIIRLTHTDLSPSTTRKGEPMWHQIVRNIKSHDQDDSNYIRQGFLEHIPRVGYRVTAAGKKLYESK